jgi:hypothetical protein
MKPTNWDVFILAWCVLMGPGVGAEAARALDRTRQARGIPSIYD